MKEEENQVGEHLVSQRKQLIIHHLLTVTSSIIHGIFAAG